MGEEVLLCAAPGAGLSVDRTGLRLGLRPEDLKREHTSRPRNPFITDVFYRRGLIEQWGRGTQKIVELCVKAGHLEPDFGQPAGSVFVRFRAIVRRETGQAGEQVSEQVTRMLAFCEVAKTKGEILAHLGLAPVYLNYRRHLYPWVQQGLLERTIPDKPQSRLQQYRLTEKGRHWLARQK